MSKVYTCSLHDYSGLNAPCPRCGLIGRLDGKTAKEPDELQTANKNTIIQMYRTLEKESAEWKRSHDALGRLEESNVLTDGQPGKWEIEVFDKDDVYQKTVSAPSLVEAIEKIG